MDSCELNEGQVVYWARCVPNCEVFDVIEVKVKNLREDYFTATDTDPRYPRSYIFYYKDVGKVIFEDRIEAGMKSNEEELTYHESHSIRKLSTDSSDV